MISNTNKSNYDWTPMFLDFITSEEYKNDRWEFGRSVEDPDILEEIYMKFLEIKPFYRNEWEALSSYFDMPRKSIFDIIFRLRKAYRNWHYFQKHGVLPKGRSLIYHLNKNFNPVKESSNRKRKASEGETVEKQQVQFKQNVVELSDSVDFDGFDFRIENNEIVDDKSHVASMDENQLYEIRRDIDYRLGGYEPYAHPNNYYYYHQNQAYYNY